MPEFADPPGDPSDNRRFRDLNLRNALTNLIQAEEHARFAQEDIPVEEVACINKHLLATRGEMGELISHAQDAAEREMAREQFKRLDERLAAAQRRGEVPDLDAIRGHRKAIEPHSRFDPRDCEVCGVVGELLRALDHNQGDMSDSPAREAQQTDPGTDAGDTATLVADPSDASDDLPQPTHAQGGPVANIAEPFYDLLMINDLTGVRKDTLGRYTGVPLVGAFGVGAINTVTTELGRRVAAGGLSLAMLSSIATGVVGDTGTVTDFLMLSGIGLGTALSPANMTELDNNLKTLEAGNIEAALIDDQIGVFGRELERVADSAMNDTRNRQTRTPRRQPGSKSGSTGSSSNDEDKVTASALGAGAGSVSHASGVHRGGVHRGGVS